jgi:hypothetical protein
MRVPAETTGYCERTLETFENAQFDVDLAAFVLGPGDLWRSRAAVGSRWLCWTETCFPWMTQRKSVRSPVEGSTRSVASWIRELMSVPCALRLRRRCLESWREMGSHSCW